MTDPDAPPAFDRRTLRPLLLGAAVLVLVAAAVAGRAWVGADRRLAHRLVFTGPPLTDAQFAQALALADSPDLQVYSLCLDLAARAADTAGRGDRVEAVILRRLGSADPLKQKYALTALGRLGREVHRDRATALRTDPDPDVRQAADAAVWEIDWQFLYPLLEVSRPLTTAEVARACDLAVRSDPGNDELAIQVLEIAAGRSADHKRTVAELFTRLAADGSAPQRQATAAAALVRLEAADVRP